MSAVAAAPKAHRIGSPITLSKDDIAKRRADLERKYGTREQLERRKQVYPLSADQFWALDELEWLESE